MYFHTTVKHNQNTTSTGKSSKVPKSTNKRRGYLLEFARVIKKCYDGSYGLFIYKAHTSW